MHLYWLGTQQLERSFVEEDLGVLGHKLRYRKYCLNVRKFYFFFFLDYVTVTEQQNRFPRDIMESPSLEIFQNLSE